MHIHSRHAHSGECNVLVGVFKDGIEMLELPDDVLEHVLGLIPIKDITEVLCICRRISDLAVYFVPIALHKHYYPKRISLQDIFECDRQRYHAEHNWRTIGVEWFIKAGASIDSSMTINFPGVTFTGTPLVYASVHGYADVVRVLLAHSVDTSSSLVSNTTLLNAKSNKGETALMLAYWNGHSAIVRMLLEYKARLDVTDNIGWTALMYAVGMHAFSDIVEMLLMNGADVNACSDCGKTALILASEMGRDGVVKMLLDHGAKVDDTGHRDGDIAATSGHTDGTGIPIPRSSNGETALIIASHTGHAKVVRTLLLYGADVNARANDGWTALMCASRFGYSAVVKILLSWGADVNIEAAVSSSTTNDEGESCKRQTAMVVASAGGYMDIVQILQDAHMDSNKRP